MTVIPGAIVILYLANPSEKYWGMLHSLTASGVTLRGLNLAGVEDWMRAVARGDEQAAALSTVFFPLLRVERITLDEQFGGVPSLHQRFEQLVGRPITDFLS